MKQQHDAVFGALYEEYQQHVWRMARRFGVPHEHLDDVTQEVWVSALKQLDGLDLSHPLKPWLTTVVWNHVRHLRRGFARQMRKGQALVDSKADGDGLEEPVARSEAAWVLERLLGDLPAEQREVLLLCDGEGLSAPEASEALGVQLNTVYSRLRLARRRCQALAASLGAAAWALALQRYTATAPDGPHIAAMLARAPDPALTMTTVGGASTAVQPWVYAVVTAAVAVAVGLGWRMGEDDVPARVEPPVVAAAQPIAPTPIELPVLVSPPAAPEVEPVVESVAPTVRAPTRKRSAVAAPSVAPRPEPPRKLAGLGAEQRLIGEARAALAAGTISRALALLGEHRRDFPNGGSAYTRDLLRYEAHCRRGDTRSALEVTAQHPNDRQFRELAEDACSSLRAQ